MTLEVLCQVLVLLDGIQKSRVALVTDHFLYAVVLFTPPPVVNGVVVVARFGNRYFEEIGVDQHGGRAHETAPAMTVDPDARDINKRKPVRQLFGRSFFIRQAIVPEVTITVVVIPFAAGGIT